MTGQFDEHQTSLGFEYFVVRLSRSVSEPDRVSGLVERLGSGEKRSFSTGEHLLQLVTFWSEPEAR
jgi:hypothetical protein